MNAPFAEGYQIATKFVLLDRIMAISAEHEADLTSGLQPAQLTTLTELLLRMASTQGLVHGVHPGFSDLHADQTRDETIDRGG